MQTSTPPGVPGTDPRTDPTAKHGDVDKNGDLVDQLERLIPAESPIDVHAHARNVANVVRGARAREHSFNAELFCETMYGRLRELRRPWTVTR